MKTVEVLNIWKPYMLFFKIIWLKENSLKQHLLIIDIYYDFFKPVFQCTIRKCKNLAVYGLFKLSCVGGPTNFKSFMLASLFSNVVSEQYREEVSVQDGSVGWNVGSLRGFNLAMFLFLQESSNTPQLPKIRQIIIFALRSLPLSHVGPKRHTVCKYLNNTSTQIQYTLSQMNMHHVKLWPSPHRPESTTGILLVFARIRKGESGLSHSNLHRRHLHWFLFKHLSKESLQFCPNWVFFRELNPKWIMCRREYLNHIQINCYSANAPWIPRQPPSIRPPDMKLVTEAYGLWLIALIYCVRVSINWSCHFVVNITKKEILSGCVRSLILTPQISSSISCLNYATAERKWTIFAE